MRAVLADADPQRSACEVLRDRDEAAARLGVLRDQFLSKLFALIEACRRAGADLLIIGYSGGAEADVAEAVKMADLCLAVSRPTLSWTSPRRCGRSRSSSGSAAMAG